MLQLKYHLGPRTYLSSYHKNRSISTTPISVFGKKNCINVKSIHSSLRSESNNKKKKKRNGTMRYACFHCRFIPSSKRTKYQSCHALLIQYGFAPPPRRRATAETANKNVFLNDRDPYFSL